jgi:hypothetical protein
MALCAMARSFMLCCAVLCCVWCPDLQCSTIAWQRALYLAASCCAVLCFSIHTAVPWRSRLPGLCLNLDCLLALFSSLPALSSPPFLDVVDLMLCGYGIMPEPGSALWQVHLAKLNGQKVVVKVQRPGLKQLFDIDLKNVRVLAQWLQNVDPKSDGAARDWVAIYDECSRILYQVRRDRLHGTNRSFPRI